MDSLLTANLANLNAFWSQLSATKHNQYNVHQSWPNKIWQANFKPPKHESADKVHVSLTAPTGADIHVILQAMSLDLAGILGERNIQVTQVSSIAELNEWTQICSSAFAYSVDEAVLGPLLADKQASLLAYKINGEIAGTAITFQTGRTMGVHQVGVHPEFTGRGIARKLMEHIIDFARSKACVLVTLQASQAGLPLYKKMGFTELGELYHYSI